MKKDYIRVIDIEQPVEYEVDTERDVDEVGVILSYPLVHRCYTADDLNDVHQLVILATQVVLVKGIYRIVHAKQVHCNRESSGQF